MVSKDIVLAIIFLILIIGGGIFFLHQQSLEEIPITNVELIEEIDAGGAIGPEDIAVDSQGRIYGGMIDGTIWRYQTDGSNPELFADTGGRPLGLHFDQAGNLIVADAYKGLLSIDSEGSITVLTTSAEGVPCKLVNDVDIAKDGTIYFSDTTSLYKLDELVIHKDSTIEFADEFFTSNEGRLLSYDPNSKTTKVLLDQLYFANGVAVSPDQSFVVIAESTKNRIQRYWIDGPNKGQSDLFTDQLPPSPDGISSNGKDSLWVAIYNPSRSAYKFDLEGNIVEIVKLPSQMPIPTSVQEHNGMLYFGSINGKSICRVPVP
jgi:sugar lactone lactonase YvrE